MLLMNVKTAIYFLMFETHCLLVTGDFMTAKTFLRALLDAGPATGKTYNYGCRPVFFNLFLLAGGTRTSILWMI